jgi:ubiquinone/menaquinone biosynthesis C-methylase UbiE
MELKSKSLAQEHFGSFAASYATSQPHARGSSLARLVALVAPQPNWIALDVATGAGHVAVALAPHLAHAIASDLTPQMLAVARSLAEKAKLANVSFAGLRAEAMPFADATFDLVTCRIAPHHFDDVGRFVTEVARVLRHGGTFGLVDNISPDTALISGDSDALANAADEYNALEKLRDPSHIRCLTLTEWRSLVTQAGLREQHVEIMDKPMVFGPWTEQQNVSEATRGELKAKLLHGSALLRAFIRPKETNGDIEFMLTEAVIVAQKP